MRIVDGRVANACPPASRRSRAVFLFDDRLVVLDALAVEGRRQQSAALPMVVVVQPEHRSRSKQPAQVGLNIAEDFRAGGEDLLGQLRTGCHHDRAIHRYVQRERVAVAVRHLVHEPAPNEREG